MDFEIPQTVSMNFSTIFLISLTVGLLGYGGAAAPFHRRSTEGLSIGKHVHCQIANVTLFAGNINWTRLTGEVIENVINTSFSLEHCSGHCHLHDKRLGLTIKDDYALQMFNLAESCKNKTDCDYLSPCCVPKKYHGGDSLVPFTNKTVSVAYYKLDGKPKRRVNFTFLQSATAGDIINLS